MAQPVIANQNTPAFRAALNAAFGTTYADMAAQIAAQANALGALGQCRLVFVNSTTIRIDRFNGRLININGVNRTIPVAGVSLSNSGLTANTTYYVYANWDGSAITLEASTVGHVNDSATGVEVKNTSPWGALVGMVRTNASSQFVDSESQRFVASWFNRRARGLHNAYPGQVGTSSTSPVELNSSFRVEYLQFAGEIANVTFAGWGFMSAATKGIFALIPDGNTALLWDFPTAPYGMINGVNTQQFSISKYYSLSEGYHYISPFGRVLSASTMYISESGSIGAAVDGFVTL